ncbi:hypothetical protein LT493_32625 [Streptomyces tricolor]|nr:hypothetical protein [Streptomyces tricolor]
MVIEQPALPEPVRGATQRPVHPGRGVDLDPRDAQEMLVRHKGARPSRFTRTRSVT